MAYIQLSHCCKVAVQLLQQIHRIAVRRERGFGFGRLFEAGLELAQLVREQRRVVMRLVQVVGQRLCGVKMDARGFNVAPAKFQNAQIIV